MAVKIGIGFAARQKLVEGVFVGSGNGDLCKERKGYLELSLAECSDLFIAAGFLREKIVRREGKDSKPLFPIFVV